MARPKLFRAGLPYSATYGQVVIPAKTYRAALKVAVAEAKRFREVVHVVHKDRDPLVVATCIPKFSSRDRRRVIVSCTLNKPIKRKRNR